VVLLESAVENFIVNVPKSQFKHNRNLLIKSGLLGHFWIRNLLKMLCACWRKLDEIRARLEHTPQKSLKLLAQEIGISKSSAAKVTKW
jgi:hypothetical protein